MFSKKCKCCNPKKESCTKDTLKEAVEHAKERADKSGKMQTTAFKDGKWETRSI